MILDYKDLEPNKRYSVMSQTVIPRPIAWIVTKDSEGVVNVAPFSYFIPLSSNPASLIVSIGHRADGMPKDTLKNIRESKKCTICMVDEAHLEQMHFSSKDLAPKESEAEHFNIKLKELEPNFPPMVEGTPVAFFCQLLQEVDLKDSKTIPLIVEIKKQFIDDTIISNKESLKIDYSPIARVGKNYALLGDGIEAPEIKE